MEEMNAQPQAESQEVNTQQEVTTQEQPQETQSDNSTVQAIKVKYNHQDMEIPYEQAIEYVQKGLNYDKINEKYQSISSDPRLQFVDEIAQSHNMSSDEYIQAAKQAMEQERLDGLIEQNIPEDIAKEILENRRFRHQFELEQKAKQQEQQQQAEYQEFISAFPNVDPKDIPTDVWKEVKEGKRLVDAYIRHDYKQLQSKLEQQHQEQSIKANNQKNAETSPVGTTGNGSTDSGYLTKEQVEANKHDKGWLSRNLDKINESAKHW